MDLLTPEETASELKVNIQTVRRWLREGKIRGRKVSRAWRIPRAELTRFLEES